MFRLLRLISFNKKTKFVDRSLENCWLDIYFGVSNKPFLIVKDQQFFQGAMNYDENSQQKPGYL